MRLLRKIKCIILQLCISMPNFGQCCLKDLRQKVVKCQHTRILLGVLCIKFIGTAFLVQNPCSSRYYHVYLEKMRIQTLAPNGESQPIPNIWRRRKKKKGNNQEQQKQQKGYCMRMPTEPELGITAPCKLWCTLDALFTSCKLVK